MDDIDYAAIKGKVDELSLQNKQLKRAPLRWGKLKRKPENALKPSHQSIPKSMLTKFKG